jgi:hypothetical protein
MMFLNQHCDQRQEGDLAVEASTDAKLAKTKCLGEIRHQELLGAAS